MASDAEWALVLFQVGQASAGTIWPSGAAGWNITFERARMNYLDGKGVEATVLELEDTEDFGPIAARLDFSSGDWASLYLEGEGIQVQADEALAALKPKPTTDCLSLMLTPQEFMPQAARAHALCPTGDQAAVTLRPAEGRSTMPFSINATKLRVIEWHNAEISCINMECPHGGRRSQSWQPLAANTSIGRETRVYQRLSSNADGVLEAQGSAAVIVVGSGSLDLTINGWLRLPLAEGTGCGGCPVPSNNTLQASGVLALEDLRMGPNGMLAGSLDGSYGSVHFDEAAIDPRLLYGASIGVTALLATGGLLALAKLLAAFTRVHSQKAQEHPRRKAIRDYIAAQPGAGFREMMRGTGISSASLRRHIEILKQTGHLAEERRGRSRRFFPTGARIADHNTTILLREPALARLLELIHRNPWLAQGEIMDLAAREFAFSRSTTQHRLGRLVQGGLVKVQRSGRHLLHATVSSALLSAQPALSREPSTTVVS